MDEVLSGRTDRSRSALEQARADLLEDLRSRGLDPELAEALETGAEAADGTVLRLSRSQRLQHLVVMLSFILLAATGFALNIPASALAGLGWAGGALLETLALLHRAAAAGLMGASLYHVRYVLFTKPGRRDLRDMTSDPRKDVRDLLGVLRAGLGTSDRWPRMGRFNYKQRVQYWAVVWGTSILTLTGLFLWTAPLWSHFVLGLAGMVHHYEALLALLVLALWHLYDVHLRPGAFPMSTAWLDGRADAQDMRDEHGLGGTPGAPTGRVR